MYSSILQRDWVYNFEYYSNVLIDSKVAYSIEFNDFVLCNYFKSERQNIVEKID